MKKYFIGNEEEKMEIISQGFMDGLWSKEAGVIQNLKLLGLEKQRRTFENIFYRERKKKDIGYKNYNMGWPCRTINWCNSELKIAAMNQAKKTFFTGRHSSQNGVQKIKTVQYIGIAADEPIRIARHRDKPGIRMPLVEIGWDEDLCGLEATYMGLLSPTYENSFRDGCWFCHQQNIGQLRRLRKIYPDLWALMLKWDSDSPVSFHPDGHSVHDFDKRFQMEEEGKLPMNKKFRWAMLGEPEQ